MSNGEEITGRCISGCCLLSSFTESLFGLCIFLYVTICSQLATDGELLNVCMKTMRALFAKDRLIDCQCIMCTGLTKMSLRWSVKIFRPLNSNGDELKCEVLGVTTWPNSQKVLWIMWFYIRMYTYNQLHTYRRLRVKVSVPKTGTQQAPSSPTLQAWVKERQLISKCCACCIADPQDPMGWILRRIHKFPVAAQPTAVRHEKDTGVVERLPWSSIRVEANYTTEDRASFQRCLPLEVPLPFGGQR